MRALLSSTAASPRTTTARRAASRHDLAFARDVLRGLGAPRKSMPGHWREDAEGVTLRSAWIALDAAHPLRLERSLLAQAAAEIAGIAGPGARLKVWDHAPIDGIARLRGAIESRPAGATRGRARRRVLYVSGRTASTLPCEAPTAVRLANAARDDDVLIFAAAMAHIDAKPGSRGESAAAAEEAFNLNLLARINRELGGDFDTAGFRHCLRFDPLTQCIESHLVAGAAQRVQALGRRFDFARGESVVVDRAHRHALARVEAHARAAGWLHSQLWVDGRASFALHVLERA